MAQHLDLEEQEQLDTLKDLWARWGTPVVTAAAVVVFSMAAWNGLQYWKSRQALQASGMFYELEQSAQRADAAKVSQIFADIRKEYPGTDYAQQAALLAGKVLFEKGQTNEAKEALLWIAKEGKNDGYQAIARLRLASLLMQQQDYEGALAQLAAQFPEPFVALAADRRGDILMLQGKKTEAVAAWTDAWSHMKTDVQYRRMIEVKLNAQGVNPQGTTG